MIRIDIENFMSRSKGNWVWKLLLLLGFMAPIMIYLKVYFSLFMRFKYNFGL